ncbi:Integrin alpha-8, partial [Ophiophagus hannah]
MEKAAGMKGKFTRRECLDFLKIIGNCSSQLCAVIYCQVGTLERDHGAMVTIQSVLWLPSFQEVRNYILIVQFVSLLERSDLLNQSLAKKDEVSH